MIHHADICNFELNGQFDIILADPPYNIGKEFANDCMPMSDYVKWSMNWIDHCMRHLNINGLIYIYGFPEHLARIACNYPVERQRWLQWTYTNKVTPSSTFYQRCHESILTMWKGDRPKLNIDAIREPYGKSHLSNVGKVRAGSKGRFNSKERITQFKDNGGALPRDVISVPALSGGAGNAERYAYCNDCGVFVEAGNKLHKDCDITIHPTQKPMALTERLLKSVKCERVLIPFAGSGSECIVAMKLNLDYVATEISEQYVKLAECAVKHYRPRKNAFVG